MYNFSSILPLQFWIEDFSSQFLSLHLEYIHVHAYGHFHKGGQRSVTISEVHKITVNFSLMALKRCPEIKCPCDVCEEPMQLLFHDYYTTYYQRKLLVGQSCMLPMLKIKVMVKSCYNNFNTCFITFHRENPIVEMF